jgi:uncharacterized protein (DUF697 family)/tellurite resistance protein
MNQHDQQAILTLAMMAAFSDGQKAEAERHAIRQLASTLNEDTSGLELPRLYQDVLLKRVSLDDAAAVLQTPELRQLAYEMAVGVCDADGEQSDAERAFLARLRTALKLDAEAVASVEQQEREMLAATGSVVAAGSSVPPASVTTGSLSGQASSVSDDALNAQIDRSILQSSLLNGALELLPQSWASMAIIPLQVKMVHGIGKAYGVELDQGHVREFIATVGVGLASQYIEQFGRKLLGGLLGKVAGRTVGGLARAGTGMAFSFATTYALGQVAKRYYAGGRVMSTALLQETFQDLLGPARQMQSRYLPQIQQTASSLDMNKVLSMVRGSTPMP